MVTIPMQVLDKKVEIEIGIFDGGGGDIARITFTNVSREGSELWGKFMVDAKK
jgi:hypothetical protein